MASRRTGSKVKAAAGGMAAPRVRIQEVGAELRTALAAVLAQSGGSHARPVTLSKSHKIDDSLAARLLRSVRASEPLSALRESPAPAGLRLFLDAAARRGAGAEAIERARAAVTRLEELLTEMPLGRASLNTAIDGWLPSGRALAERSGSQAVFKALSQTLGFTVDAAFFAMAIQPSAAGDACDSLVFFAMEGIRRLREGSPILLFGHSWQPRNEGRHGVAEQHIETLDGEREVTDARKLILKDVGDGATLPLRMIERGTHTRVVLESGTPELNVPVTVAVSNITRNAYRRFATERQKTEVESNACKVPVRVLVQDLFIHEDVFPNFVPNVVARMDSLGVDAQDRDEELLEVDRLELDVEMVRLGWGLERSGVKEWGGYEPALASAFERAGWDARKFRAYRCYVRYPLPYVALSTWFDLPGRP